MNLMGKIFTVLILILSVAFLVVAVMVGASHRNWKQAAEDNRQRASLAERQLEAAKSRSTEKEKQLAAEQVARAFQLSQLESQLNIARQNRETTQRQLQEELVISQKRLDSLQQAEARLAELDQQIATLKTENSKLIDDIAAQRLQVVNKTNQLYKVQGEKDDLELLVQDLTSQVAQKTKVMNAMGIRDDALVDHIEPRVDGVVKGVSGNLIVVSLGSDDGLRSGHLVDIYRGDRFVGKAKILTAEFDQASARVMAEYQQSRVQEGDHVTTKL